MLLDVSKHTFAQYALQGSGLNVACYLADELDTKLLTLLLVAKQTTFPDDLYEYKLNLYNWAHDVRNKLHSIPLYALHLGTNSALQTFCSIYDECQGLRTEVCNDSVSSMFPAVNAAAQALALTTTSGSSEPCAMEQTSSEDTKDSWVRQQQDHGHVIGPTATKRPNQVLLEAVEKIQGKTWLPSPPSSKTTGGLGADEQKTNKPCLWRKDIEPHFSSNPTRPIPEPVTPPEFDS